MESLEDKIKKFLSASDGYGDGDGYGYGYGSGDGYGYGSGYGSGYGYGNGSGYGSGYGYGYGSGSGDGYGSGYGDGYGDGIGAFQGKKVYKVDGVNTIFECIHGNIARGYILNRDFSLDECYVAKVENRYFAHGSTPQEAFRDAQSKAFENMPVDQRVESFVKEFPTLDTMVEHAVLYCWHNRLTGSCEMGRRNFAQQHNIDVENGQMSVRSFIELTKDSYGGDVMMQLLKRYE